MVDVGATRISLTYEDAERLGLRPHPSDYTLRTRTANGVGRVAQVMLDSVQIGDVEVHYLQGLVAEQGKLHSTLLRMAFVRKLERFELRGSGTGGGRITERRGSENRPWRLLASTCFAIKCS
jgi:aspartyl protease family protein